MRTNAVAGVGVGVLVTRRNKVLLIKRIGSHGSGTWACPGGHIDFGETIEQCAIRETKEETGLEVGNVEFRAITNDVFEEEDKHYVTIWVTAGYAGGEERVASSREATEVGWFAWDKLPQPLFLPLENLVKGKKYPNEKAL